MHGAQQRGEVPVACRRTTAMHYACNADVHLSLPQSTHTATHMQPTYPITTSNNLHLDGSMNAYRSVHCHIYYIYYSCNRRAEHFGSHAHNSSAHKPNRSSYRPKGLTSQPCPLSTSTHAQRERETSGCTQPVRTAPASPKDKGWPGVSPSQRQCHWQVGGGGWPPFPPFTPPS